MNLTRDGHRYIQKEERDQYSIDPEHRCSRHDRHQIPPGYRNVGQTFNTVKIMPNNLQYLRSRSVLGQNMNRRSKRGLERNVSLFSLAANNDPTHTSMREEQPEFYESFEDVPKLNSQSNSLDNLDFSPRKDANNNTTTLT